jgi:hypothetical protein
MVRHQRPTTGHHARRMRRKPSPRLSAILAACGPTSEVSLGSRSRALSPSNDPATPGSERRRRPQPDGRQPRSAARYRAGSARHRNPWSTPGASGHDRRTRTAVTRPAPLRPRAAKQHEAGFESHLTAAAGQRPMPRRQASPRSGLTLPPRWAIAARPEPCSPSPAVPRTCPTHRSTAVIHGQQGSVHVPSELQDRSIRSGPRELPKLVVVPLRVLMGQNAVHGRRRRSSVNAQIRRCECGDRGVHTRQRRQSGQSGRRGHLRRGRGRPALAPPSGQQPGQGLADLNHERSARRPIPPRATAPSPVHETRPAGGLT